MKSLKSNLFSRPLAENQPEYNTLFVHYDLQQPLAPATVCFELSDEDLAAINKSKRIYYQQCLGRMINEDGNATIANLFHPMSLHFVNPVAGYHKNNRIEDLIQLDDVEIVKAFSKNDQLTADSIREILKEAFADGCVYIPTNNCDNFHPVQGCQGHAIPVQE